MQTNRMTADEARALTARMRAILADDTAPIMRENYTTDDDGDDWRPQEACEACGMVDAQTDQQDDNGDAWRMCQACQDDNDDMMGGN